LIQTQIILLITVMDTNLYPMTFEPVYKDYPWGGSRIPETYHRNKPAGIYAESWEISDHNDGMSVVSNGWMNGKSLRRILQDSPQEIMGTAVSGTKFPLLIKLIDAKQKLSVQVHPDDATAAEFGGEAKTEMWYLLGDNPALVYCGLNDDVTKESFLRAVDDGTSGEAMRAVPVEKGSAVFVRGGRVHAIDETFQCTEVLACEYFRLEKLVFSAPLEVPMFGKTFHALFVAEGYVEIHWEDETLVAPAGTSVLVPAALPAYTLDGKGTVLRTTIP
jgi:mannose-6-phosphate isomerase class I